MGTERDPVAEHSDGERDLYDVATWERRSALDDVAARLYSGVVAGGRGVLVLLAAALLVAQLGVIGYAFYFQPTIGLLTLASVLPAVLLVGGIWYMDATMREPLVPLAVTFVLAVLFAAFAAVINSQLSGFVKSAVPVFGLAVFFFLVVGPVEETVKWLAVRVFAYDTDSFDAVVDGAVYGAVAGLGFATIENALYLTQSLLEAGSLTSGAVLDATVSTAYVRAFVGPGHVIYSAFAGYYLGLAKFNPENWGTIVVKGLLVASLIHATYNTAVNYLPLPGLAFLAFIVVYDGVFGYVLYRKLAAYRDAYRDTVGKPEEAESGGETTASS